MKQSYFKKQFIVPYYIQFFQFFMETEISDSPILRNSGISDSKTFYYGTYNIVFVTTFHIIEKCYFFQERKIFKCSFFLNLFLATRSFLVLLFIFFSHFEAMSTISFRWRKKRYFLTYMYKFFRNTDCTPVKSNMADSRVFMRHSCSSWYVLYASNS